MAIRTKPPQWHQQFTTWTPDYVTGPAGEEDTRNGGAYALPAASPAGDGHGVRSPGAACPSATRHGWRGASSDDIALYCMQYAKYAKKYARYAKYANVIFNMQNMHRPLC